MIDYKYVISEWKNPKKLAIRTGAGEGLLKLGENQNDVVVLTADLAESTRVREFADRFPERFFDIGVAEQNMIGVAAGLANEGFVPFTASYATFSPGRSWEQVRVSVCLSNSNVKIIGSHAGVSSGLNGPSHQGTEDIAIMRVLPNMIVLAPCDGVQASAAIQAVYDHNGPAYIRTTRPETPVFTTEIPFEIGKAYVYREGKDLTICAFGIQVYDALIVAEELAKEGVECEVINISTIKPLDHYTIVESVKKTGKVVTIEDHQISGGMGSTVAEMLGEQYPVPIKRIGINDRFGYSGDWQEVYKKVGLDTQSLKKAVVDWLHE
ncbi:MAG: transketolase C-terminal domain-containing protein [Microgenomates group bacterium]